MVLHSFAAYLRAIWASCHGYDNIPAEELEDHPEAYLPGCADADIDLADGSTFSGDCGVVMYDDVFEFEDMAETTWSITSQIGVTPRMMWDFADWNVQFNLGTFYEKSGLSTSAYCDQANVESSRWFTDEGPMLGSKNAAFDQWVKEMPPPLKKEEEVEEEQGGEESFEWVPDRNPYGGGQSEGQTGVARFMRAQNGHSRQSVSLGQDQELVDIEGAVDTSAVKNSSNYLMLTCIILVLLGIGLALYVYNNRKSKMGAFHTLPTEAYGSV